MESRRGGAGPPDPLERPVPGALSARLLQLRAAQLDERPIEELRAWDLAAAAAAEARVAAASLEMGARVDIATGGSPTIITWYLSAASPFCRATLSAWAEAAGGGDPEANGPPLRILLLAAESPEPAARAAEDVGDVIRLEHDDGRWADLFGIRYAAPSVFRELLGLEIDAVPLPATYVLTPDGVVLSRFVHPDSRFRAEPAACLAVARG